MQIDVDYYTAPGGELPSKYHSNLIFNVNFFCAILLGYLKLVQNHEYAVLRMYGVTEGGHSVMAHVHNFLSYFYVEISDQFRNDKWTEEDLDNIKKSINGMMQNDCVAHIEVQTKASVMYFQKDSSKFLKIFVHLPKYVNQMRQLFE